MPPCPVEELPQTCTCGEPLTYSDDLVFVSRPELEPSNAIEVAEVCYTCKEPYSKPPTFRAMICSNSFHCCKDCSWGWENDGAFSKGTLVRMCPECAEKDRESKEEWARDHPV